MNDGDNSLEQMEQSLQAFKAKTHQAFVRNGNPNLPRLYHYTDARGAMGIIDGNCLWATDTEFMNDERELEYSRDVCANIIDKYIQKVVNNEEKSFLLNLKEYIHLPDHTTQTNRTYACSFSEKNDDAGQWLIYANRIGGVALGFDPHNLASRNCRRFLIQVEYDPLVQCERFSEIIQGGLDIFRKFKPSPLLVTASCSPEICAALNYLFLAFKSKGWASEKEWKLVLVDQIHEADVKYRDGKAGLTPYVIFSPNVGTRYHGKLPFEDIVLGPASPLRHKAFEWYLNSKKLFPSPTISRSELALRF